MPATQELPSTIRRSPPKAQRTWIKAHDAAVQEYGEGEAAHRVAFAGLKHSFEKVGDHWEPEKQRGPSDPRSKLPTPLKRRGVGATGGGVDVEGHTREELLERARRLGIRGRSRMTKLELGQAMRRQQD